MMYSFPCSVGLEKSSGDWKHRELLSLSLSLLLPSSFSIVVFSLLQSANFFRRAPFFSHARLFRSLVILFHAAYRTRPPTFLLELGSFYREGGIETNDLEGNFHFTNDSKRPLMRNHHARWRDGKTKRFDRERYRERIINEFIFTWKMKRNIWWWFPLRRIHTNIESTRIKIS